MNMNVSARIGYHEVVDLRRDFPISWKYSFRKNLGWLAIFCLAVLALLGLEAGGWLPGELEGFMQRFRPAVYRTLGVILLFKLIHTELYRLTLYYGTEGFRLVVSRGIILKQRGSLPLLPISEIYIQRSFTDLMCGLCNVNVFTPMDQTRQFARIECLDNEVALNLQHFLNDILTTQVFLAPQAMQGERVEDPAHGQDHSAPAAHDQQVNHATGGHDHGSKDFNQQVMDPA